MKIKKKRKSVARKPAAKAAKPSSQYKKLDDVCAPDMIAFHFWREWHRARERNDWAFMREMAGEDSPFLEKLGDEATFSERCRRRDDGTPGLRAGVLRRISLAGEDAAHMIEVVGADEYNARSYEVVRWYMLRGEGGWRLHDWHRAEVAPEELEAQLEVSAFPEVSQPDGFVGRSELGASEG